MRSKPSSDEIAIRATPADSAALERFAKDAARGCGDYLRFLSQFKATYEQLKAKPGPQGEPFRL